MAGVAAERTERERDERPAVVGVLAVQGVGIPRRPPVAGPGMPAAERPRPPPELSRRMASDADSVVGGGARPADDSRAVGGVAAASCPAGVRAYKG